MTTTELEGADLGDPWLRWRSGGCLLAARRAVRRFQRRLLR